MFGCSLLMGSDVLKVGWFQHESYEKTLTSIYPGRDLSYLSIQTGLRGDASSQILDSSLTFLLTTSFYWRFL